MSNVYIKIKTICVYFRITEGINANIPARNVPRRRPLTDAFAVTEEDFDAVEERDTASPSCHSSAVREPSKSSACIVAVEGNSHPSSSDCTTFIISSLQGQRTTSIRPE